MYCVYIYIYIILQEFSSIVGEVFHLYSHFIDINISCSHCAHVFTNVFCSIKTFSDSILTCCINYILFLLIECVKELDRRMYVTIK